MRKKLLVPVFVALFLALAGTAPALEGRETARIEAFLALLASKADIVFVRNGSKYPVSRAVSHLRSKLSRAKNRISTAEEFIDHVASVSSVSGKPYSVIFPGGEEAPAGPYFRELLRESDGTLTEGGK
ncbi:MAG: YfeK family protein [Deltaproteobacteria bacterium]|jgi:hypothetical protein|nr:YfeK family protein [Deltaproteobacteria bacterium]